MAGRQATLTRLAASQPASKVIVEEKSQGKKKRKKGRKKEAERKNSKMQIGIELKKNQYVYVPLKKCLLPRLPDITPRRAPRKTAAANTIATKETEIERKGFFFFGGGSWSEEG